MPTLSDNFDIPSPLATGEGADLPGAMEAQNDRLDAIFSAGIRSSGVSAIDTEQTTSSTTYTELGTPDRVEDIVLPTNGLLLIGFRALVKDTGTGGNPDPSKAAVFIGSNQLKVPFVNGAPAALETSLSGTFGTSPTSAGNDNYSPLVSSPTGLALAPSLAGTTSDSSFVTTGMALAVGGLAGLSGGFLFVEADAGTYDVAVKFKQGDATRTLSVKSRRLWVVALAFGMPPP